jgi:predicted nucleic acid-binding protein
VKVVVDTSIWSLLFRRPFGSGPEVEELRRLVARGEAVMIGPVRQEILSGIREYGQFIRLRNRLRSFRDHRLSTRHFERAAAFYNTCRSKGIQASSIDFLICAVAETDQMPVFTTDRDFERFRDRR